MSQDKPLCIDLFCGLGGWAEAFIAESYHCRGYDIEAHDYGTGGYPGELILRDVRSITGEECKDAAVIVASPPCQAYSYRAMPWKRAKALPPPDNTLFNECFRIQREASEAAGHYIPLIVENVRGAQKWVGRARWHYGSFYLWGDVPALMPPIIHQKIVGYSDPRRNGGKGAHLTSQRENDGRKVPGLSPGRFPPGGLAQGALDLSAAQRYREGMKNDGSGWLPNGTLASCNRMVPDGVKQAGISGVRENGKGDKWFQDGAARHGSRSDSRKAASAMIAKIPYPLASHIARCFYPAEGNNIDDKIAMV